MEGGQAARPYKKSEASFQAKSDDVYKNAIFRFQAMKLLPN
jgi:hypothetical protein